MRPFTAAGETTNHKNSCIKCRYIVRSTKICSLHYSITNETTTIFEIGLRVESYLIVEWRFRFEKNKCPNFKEKPETKLNSAIAENTLLPHRILKNERESLRGDRKLRDAAPMIPSSAEILLPNLCQVSPYRCHQSRTVINK